MKHLDKYFNNGWQEIKSRHLNRVLNKRSTNKPRTAKFLKLWLNNSKPQRFLVKVW